VHIDLKNQIRAGKLTKIILTKEQGEIIPLKELEEICQ
jgi:hypothetical protein